MKLCWDNLEGFYLTKNGTLYRPKKFGYKLVLHFKECVVCKKEFLGNKPNFCCSPKCRNIYLSGKNHWTKFKKFSEKAKRKMSEARQGKYFGKNNNFYGKHHTEESKQKMRGPRPEWSGKNHWLYRNMTFEEREKWLDNNARGINGATFGMKFSKESRKKMSIAKLDKMSGKNNPMYGMCGELSPNWKGGYSYKDYCGAFYDEEFKQDIRGRDHNICWTCGKSKKPNKQNLIVHHIDHNKQNCNPNNLITLCPRCHGIIQIDIIWYEEWYKRIMNKRFGYIYE